MAISYKDTPSTVSQEDLRRELGDNLVALLSRMDPLYFSLLMRASQKASSVVRHVETIKGNSAEGKDLRVFESMAKQAMQKFEAVALDTFVSVSQKMAE